MNPGSPAPQAGILDQSSTSGTRIASYSDTVTRRRPQITEIKHEDLVINTLLKAKSSGLAENTLRSISYSLNQIGKNADLNNPEEVKAYVANMNVSNSTKQKHINNYNYYCITKKIEWNRPSYKWERKIPLIPTTENINKIISASSRKFATIFTILKEIGLEGRELATTHRKQIDAERGIINAQGCKRHNSRSFKLKPSTADLLRTYLHEYKDNYPFPKSKIIGNMWQKFRNRLAQKINDPQLKSMPLRNLRHHYATRLYDKTKDILLVKQRLGHKKNRNNNVLHTTNPLRRRRRVHMQNSKQHQTSNTTNRKRIPIHHRNKWNKTIQKTQITLFFLLYQPIIQNWCSCRSAPLAPNTTD